MSRAIKRIVIKNFQSHEFTELEFDTGINIITGTSNAGKTAINRAINWALSNKPRGDYFIRHGTTFSAVKIVFFDGSELLRMRGSEENFVKIKYVDGKVEKYEKFGSDYPEAVKKFLSIPKESDILGNIFYADQMSPLFLVNLSSADLPRAIGYLAGSDVMELASKNMQQESRQTKRDSDKLSKEINALKKDVSKFNKLESQLELMDKCKSIQESVQKKIDLKNSIESAINQSDAKMAHIENINKQLVSLEKIQPLYDVSKKLNILIDSHNTANKLLTKYQVDENNIQESKSTLNALNTFFSKVLSKKQFENTKSTLTSSINMLLFLDNHTKKAEQSDSTESAIKQIDRDNALDQKKIQKMKNTLLKANYICSTCGQKINS